MSIINTHITFFAGLPNLNLPLPATTTLSDLFTHLPQIPNLRLTTTSGHSLHPTPTPLSTLTTTPLLTLRAHVPLCGGKGGFGSQLRAAGGRMSSRKKSQENSDSCRNLDGRRLRTVKEAKALAEYLEVKPEMEREEREKRMQRWKEVVEQAEKRGEGGEKRRFDDVAWVEGVEEGRERTREAVVEAMRGEGGEGSGSSGAGSDVEVEERGERRFAGWDEDEEFLSSDDEMAEIREEEESEEEYVGKGKGKAVAVGA